MIWKMVVILLLDIRFKVYLFTYLSCYNKIDIVINLEWKVYYGNKAIR